MSMKRIVCFLLAAAFVIFFAGCAKSEIDIQSSGGSSVDDVLEKYAAAFANIDYKTFSGNEVLPYMTEEWGKKWRNELSSQYVDAYKKNKFVREFTSVDISNVQVDGNTATATIIINSSQKEPSVKECSNPPEKVSLKKVDEKWFIDNIER